MPAIPRDTDCNDANDDVFPGQTAFFTAPISGAPAATAYDYNCTRLNNRQYGCFDCRSGAGCEAGSGYTCAFSATTPDCGGSDLFTRCVAGAGGTCTSATSPSVVQGCR